jgi:plasmid stabilization system protein ParE
LIRLTAEASRQISQLAVHYRELGRPEAVANLRRAVAAASQRIEAAPNEGLPAPRPYPELVCAGRAWIKEGPYWFLYSVRPLVILAVFYESADIPGRI